MIVDDLPVPGAVVVEPMLIEVQHQLAVSQTKGLDTYRSLICLAMVKNACSTLVAFLADVSRKGMESWSANSWE